MGFEWDETKNLANIRKHGVSFDTAKRIFERPIATWIDHRKDSRGSPYEHWTVGTWGADRGYPYRSGRAYPLDLRPSGVPQGKASLP